MVTRREDIHASRGAMVEFWDHIVRFEAVVKIANS